MIEHNSIITALPPGSSCAPATRRLIEGYAAEIAARRDTDARVREARVEKEVIRQAARRSSPPCSQAIARLEALVAMPLGGN